MEDNDEVDNDFNNWIQNEVAKYKDIRSKEDFFKILRIKDENDFLKERHFILSFQDNNGDSVLSLAITKNNFEFAKFLISKYPYLIQQLPFENKLKISTDLYKSKEFELVCDLIEFSDYPFPNEFDKKSCSNKRLQNISKERIKFHKSISNSNLVEISKFIGNNENLKYVFNCDNKPAIEQARDLTNREIYCYLKSKAFQAIKSKEYFDDLDDDSTRKATKDAMNQMERNIKESLENMEKPALMLIARSKIHNLQKNKENETKYRQKIKEWFDAISSVKYGDWLLKTAFQCEDLQIIFDFQSSSVEYMDPRSSESCAGVTYPTRKWIMIGSKYETEDREQEIKGVIAHELCHYILGIIFDNKDLPYYSNDLEARKEFAEIVKRIKNAITNSLAIDKNDAFNDDGCNNIISSVYQMYKPHDHPQELIVRVLHMLAYYDNDEFKSDELEKKYKILFDFFEKYVLTELKAFNLKDRTKIRKFNKKSGIISKIEKEEFKFKNTEKDFNEIISVPQTLVYSNIPELVYSLLYANIKNLRKVREKNIFIDSEALSDKKVLNDIIESIKNIADFRIIIDCTKVKTVNIRELVNVRKDINLVLIATNENFENIKKCVEDNGKCMNLEFKFNDLSNDTKLKVLQEKINFQCTETNFFNLLSSDEDLTKLKKFKDGLSKDAPPISDDFVAIIDNKILELFIKKIPINIDSRDDFAKQKIFYKTNAISNENFLNSIENDNVSFITGDYGSGKSWKLKHLTTVLREKCQNQWVSYINLQNYANNIKPSSLDFQNFIADEFLKLESDLEKNLFNFLYKNGRVILLVDDTNDVSKFIRNDLNKLFNNLEVNKIKFIIATRKIENWNQTLRRNGTEFKLNNFSQENGLEIVKSFISDHQNKDDFLKFAQEFSDEFLKMNNFQNLPIFYKMIGKFLKNVNLIEKNLSVFETIKFHVSNEFLKNQNIDIKLVHKQHHFFAMSQTFPKMKKSWKKNNVNIKPYGFLTENDNGHIFVNNIFKDYFITEYILVMLVENNFNENSTKIFRLVLHQEEHSRFRSLLNSALSDETTYQKLKEKTNLIATVFGQNLLFLDIVNVIVTETLENFVKLLAIIFKNIESRLILDIFENNHQNLRMFRSFLQLLKPEEIDSCIESNEIFQKFVESNISINEFNKLLKTLNEKQQNDLIQKGLILKTQKMNENIIHIACKKPYKIKEIFELISNYLCPNVITKLLLAQEDKNENTFLHTFAKLKKSDDYSLIPWDDIFKQFIDANELKNLLLAKNKKGQTFLHIFVIQNNINEIENFLNALNDKREICKEILGANHYKNRNLIQIAAGELCDILTHEFLWGIYKNNFVDENLKDLLKSCDEDGKNILQIAACTADTKTFEFLISKVNETIKPSNNENVMKYFFSSIDDTQKNLLQFAAIENKSLDFHICLWKVLKSKTNFNESDVYGLVNYIDESGNNMRSYIAKYNTDQVKQLFKDETQNSNISNDETDDNSDDEEHNEIVAVIDQYPLNNQNLEEIRRLELEDRIYSGYIFLKTKYFYFYAIIILVIGIAIGLYIHPYVQFYFYSQTSIMQTINNSTVSYKNVNMKFEKLFNNTNLSFNKIINHIESFKGTKVVNLDEKQFLELTSMIIHKYYNIDKKLKDIILNSDFFLNNETYKYKTISDNYPEALNALSSEQILKILNNEHLYVGPLTSEPKPLNIVGKNDESSKLFHDYLKDSNKEFDIIDNGNLDTIIFENFEKIKFFLLKIEVQSGLIKSYDIDSIKKVKNKFPHHWISYFDLRDCLKYININNKMESSVVVLNQLLNLKDNLEKQIFSSFYNANNTILLWDGFDEIPSKYQDLIVKLISNIHQNTSNIQVVSVHLAFEKLSVKDQETIKQYVVQYKNIKLKLSEIFTENSEFHSVIIPIHISKILNNEDLNLSNPEFAYLEKLTNHKWETLNKNLKDKVLNAEILFQNQKIKFMLIDQLNSDILPTLTSDQISSILNGKILEVGKLIKNPIDPIYLKEKLKNLKTAVHDHKICSNNTLWNHLEEFKFQNDFESVNNENLSQNLKIGKPPKRQIHVLTLKSLEEVINGFDQSSILKIKEIYPLQWIAYINRGEFLDYLKNRIDNSMQMFLERFVAINSKNEFEKNFIKASYSSGGFIFFWDGFFETSFEETNKVIKYISNTYKNTQNIQFISSQVKCFEVKEEIGFFAKIKNWLN